MLLPGQKTTLALESTAQYQISAFLMVGQLLERMMSLASPDLRDLRVDLYPSTYLPLLMTSASLLLMFSLPTFFTIITINLLNQYIHSSIQYLESYLSYLTYSLILFNHQIYTPTMRKNTQRQHYLFPKIQPALVFNEPSLEELSTLEKYQMQMQYSESAKKPIVNFRIKRTFTEPEDSPLANGLREVTREIKDLKKQIRRKRSTAKDSESLKFGRLLSEFEDGIYRNKSMMQPNYVPPQQPLYVPVPFPMYMPQPTTQLKESFYNRTLRKKSQARFGRGKKNLKKWRKVGNCLLFYFYLKRFCRVARVKRKVVFDKFIQKIKNYLTGLKTLINGSLDEFFSILVKKQSVSFDFEEGDNQAVVKQKLTSLRKMVGLVLECLLEFAVQNAAKSEVVQSLYLLCRHGNFSCNELLMTKQQLQISCISKAFKYVSADSHLQKSAIINLIFFKMLLYNNFLSPIKMGARFTQDQIPTNLYLVSSILYQLCIDYQDEEMLLVSPIYSIGNYQSVEKVRVLESIVVKEGSYRQGDLISGLKDERWIKKYFKIQSWSEQKKNLKQMVELLHGAMIRYHSKIIQPYF